MNYTSNHSKRYPLVLLPQPQQRFNSLKASHSYFHNQQFNLTKRHSLDSKANNQCNRISLVDNAEDLPQKKQWASSKGSLPRKHCPPKHHEINIKYYCRVKQPKSKINPSRAKRNWSELDKQLDKNHKKREISKSKWQQSAKINVSDRIDTNKEVTYGKSTESHLKKHLFGNRIKLVKSLLNSTMLTKRGSDESKPLNQSKYAIILLQLQQILLKYQERVKRLKESKQYYRLKLKKLKKKKFE